jgi:formiminoglutamase
VDLDVVAGMSASAASPSGLSADEARRCVCTLAAVMDARALHICEGIPGEGDASGAGKLAALIACDFIKAVQGRRA